MVTHRDNRWDTPRKRALFMSDGPDSMTSDSDIPEGHADRPPEVEYSERLIAAKRQDEGGTEILYSPIMELEMAVIQLQRDFDDCRKEFELTRKGPESILRRSTSGLRAGEIHVDTSSMILREVDLGTVP